MIDFEEMGALLVPIFRPILSLGDDSFPLIQIPSDFPSPERSYATIFISEDEEVGQMDEGLVFETFGQQVKQDINITVRIQTFGSKARTRASALRTKLQYPSVTTLLGDAGFCWRSTTPVRNLSAKVTSSFEDRASFDLRLGTSWGNLSTIALDPEEEGVPSTGTFDEQIVPLESVQLDVYVDDTPSSSGDEKLVNSTIINPE